MQLGQLQLDRVQVYLLFYRPSESDPFQNRLVALFDGPFSHVEMAFPERYGEEPWEREVWGSSIYQGESVFFRPRTYLRDGYVSFALEVSTAQMLKIKHYCRVQAEREVPFSLSAMYAAYLPVQVAHTEATFCSKHVTRALQYALLPEIMGLNPALVTPSRLYRALMAMRGGMGPIVHVVPSRLGPLSGGQCSERMVREMAVRGGGRSPGG